jgi:deoxyribodipyrimidine photolyase-like uncharacterized protein
MHRVAQVQLLPLNPPRLPYLFALVQHPQFGQQILGAKFIRSCYFQQEFFQEKDNNNNFSALESYVSTKETDRQCAQEVTEWIELLTYAHLHELYIILMHLLVLCCTL